MGARNKLEWAAENGSLDGQTEAEIHILALIEIRESINEMTKALKAGNAKRGIAPDQSIRAKPTVVQVVDGTSLEIYDPELAHQRWIDVGDCNSWLILNDVESCDQMIEIIIEAQTQMRKQLDAAEVE